MTPPSPSTLPVWKGELFDKALVKYNFVECEDIVERLKEIVDTDECSYDHHGYCQIHSGCNEPMKCNNVKLKELIAELERKDK